MPTHDFTDVKGVKDVHVVDGAVRVFLDAGPGKSPLIVLPVEVAKKMVSAIQNELERTDQ